ncbi:hypothetical protein KIN20_026341, partial [Parelaphostrongylus tenuis]
GSELRRDPKEVSQIGAVVERDLREYHRRLPYSPRLSATSTAFNRRMIQYTLMTIKIMRDRTVGESTDCERFREFKAGNEELADGTISGQPSELGDEDLISGLENEPSSSSRDSAAEPGVSHTSVLIHLHQLDFVPRTKDRIHTNLPKHQQTSVFKFAVSCCNPLNDRFGSVL